jgi:hypothetical protein
VSDPLKGAPEREEAERKKLQEVASVAAAGALGATTIRAAEIALDRITQRDGGNPVTEPARDVLAIRSDSELNKTLAEDLRVAEALAVRLIVDALWLGFVAGTKRAKGLPIVVDLDDSDRAQMRTYPVVGYTPDEIAADLAYQLRRDAERALTLPLTSAGHEREVPATLGDVSYRHAQRVGLAVAEAHASGVSAAVRAIGAVLIGAT